MRRPNKSTMEQLIIDKINTVAEIEYALNQHYQQFKRLPRIMYLTHDLYEPFLNEPSCHKTYRSITFHGIIVKEL